MVFDVKRLGKVLAEVVAGAGLQGLAISHHRFDGVGLDRSGKLLTLRLFTLDHRKSHVVFGEAGVDLEHAQGFLVGLFLRGVGGMTLLPQELRGPQEETGSHLPTHDIGPLIDQQRQITVGLNPIAVGIPDDCLRSGTDDVRLFQFLATSVGDHGQFGGEALHVLRFLFEETLGDQHREVGVDVPGLLEHAVENRLHLFPDPVSVGLDDHRTAHRSVLGEFGPLDHFLVPARIVFGWGRQFCSHGVLPLER